MIESNVKTLGLTAVGVQHRRKWEAEMSTDTARASALPFLAGLFLICMCSLMLQILETRLISVISVYYMAFFAISMAMFGMTAGSLLIYFKPDIFTAQRIYEHLTWIAWAFGLSVFISVLLLITTTIVGEAPLLITALVWLKTIVVIVLPYVLAGMAISLALTRTNLPIGLVYAVDLVGAATGCLVVLALMSRVDGVSALFAVGAIGGAASVCFAIAQGRLGATAERQPGSLALRRAGLLALLLVGVTVGNAAIQPRGLAPVLVKGEVEVDRPAALAWNSFSRVRARAPETNKPYMWGPSPKMPSTVATNEMYLNIDGNAATALYQFDGDFGKVDFLRYDVTNLAYSIRNSGRSAVIGVGGGRDVLSAHMFGFADVTGVELNPIFINWLTHRFRDFDRVADIPGTHLNVDEARSWFARTQERFDLIEMSLIDTWAATGAGAYSLSENGLYTVNAWSHFLNSLTPTGVFTVSRWYDPSSLTFIETGRLLSLATSALRERGVKDPRAHIFLAGTSNLATIIVGAAPLTQEDLSKLHAASRDLGFAELVSPDREPGEGPIRDVILARTNDDLARLTRQYHLDLSAPTDERPFFFNQLVLTDPASISLARKAHLGVIRGNIYASETILLIMALSLALAVAAIIIPSLPSVRRTSARLATLGTAYFALIGLGFMFIEIGIIQRVSVFLGHPVYGLAIGLFSMIFSTGIGSLVSERVRLDTQAKLLIWVVLLVFFLLTLTMWFPALVSATERFGLIIRAAIALAAIVPAGVLMGFGFPTGMRLVNAIDRRPTPWFWAVNGACGVLAASVAVGVSIAFSISASLATGAICYLLLAPVALGLIRGESALAAQARRARSQAQTEPTKA